MSFGADSRAARGATSSIRQQVHDNGSFESILVWSDQRFEISDLVGRADLVIEASSAGGRSYLDKSEAHIYTDYVFNVHQLIKNRRRAGLLRIGSTITVRREGGSIEVDGRPAVTIENEFPPFNGGEHYILFLKQWPGDNAYEVFGGPQGVFKSGDNITSIATGLPLARQVFLGEVRALLQFTE
jgi:hypothetical protein